MTRRPRAYALLAAAAALPRLAVLLTERDDVIASFTEKSDEFARTFVASGTYGFIPGEPSAYTQPLYGFFLIPIYEVFGRSWASIGLAQIAIAVATTFVVYEVGRRWISPTAGLLAGVVAALHPYLIWHDVHVNREILDTFLAVALVLATLAAAERRSPALAAVAGAIAGVAILGNSRLVLLPLVLVGFLAWRFGARRRVAIAAAALLVACAVVVSPWVARNRVSVGCYAITTDARALWKANNEQTYEILSSGRWIDAVQGPPGAPPTPEMAWGEFVNNGHLIRVDECAQMRFYQRETRRFWREQPGEKARLAVLSAGLLWDPRTTRAEGRPEAGTWLDTARTWGTAVYLVPLYVLAVLGLRAVPRHLAVLALCLLVYATAAAMLFVGATRYRVAFDFLLALLAAAAVVHFGRRAVRGS